MNVMKKGSFQVDNFEVEAVDLEDLTKVVIGHAGKGIFSGWFLEKVIIKDSEHATKKFVFNCERYCLGTDPRLKHKAFRISEIFPHIRLDCLGCLPHKGTIASKM